MKSLLWREGRRLLVALVPFCLVVSLIPPIPAQAESLLAPDEEILLRVPTADFDHELARLHLPTPPHKAKPTDVQEGAESRAELSDLSHSKSWQALGESARQSVLKRVAAARTAGAAADFTEVPGEFVDYLKGAIAWRGKKPTAARSAWKLLLERPAEERRFKSTWAAYMLGRACSTNEWEEAVRRFQQVRQLAQDEFTDSLGLASASYGWEARAYLDHADYARALRLYLDQHATGDSGAAVSVHLTLAKALTHGTPAQLHDIASDPLLQQAVGGWLVAHRENLVHGDDSSPYDRIQRLKRWVAALEQVQDLPTHTVEHIVLAAFQRGEQELSRQWIRRAPTAPICQWLTAKLWLRAGNPKKALTILERIQYAFPLESVATSSNRPLTLEAGLSSGWYRSGGQRLQGELGALKLSQRDYAGALDAFLKGKYWSDAAYVAERVLTLEELRNYVDAQWPELDGDGLFQDSQKEMQEETESQGLRKKLRALLGRRLVRSNQGHEAFEYLQAPQHQRLLGLLNAMTQGADETHRTEDRADNWWIAAQAAREHGMELMGTELEPDWAITGGNGSRGITLEERASTNTLAKASPDELQRARRHGPISEATYHYRYVAAAMAWRAAKMMPNNNPTTARVLCTAGSWLKGRDANSADYFYKSLVRRCRRTAIGDQADRMRWFPTLDEVGQPIPWEPRIPHAMQQEAADGVEMASDPLMLLHSDRAVEDGMESDEESDEVNETEESDVETTLDQAGGIPQ